MKYFEDIDLDFKAELGPRHISLDEMLRFSNEFDRLPFHIDQARAEQTMFGGLIASGLHTLSFTAGIIVDEFLLQTSMTGASQMTDVRWLSPVRPGEDLKVRLCVLEKKPHPKGKPFGTIVVGLETLLRDGTVAMTAKVSYLFATRG